MAFEKKTRDGDRPVETKTMRDCFDHAPYEDDTSSHKKVEEADDGMEERDALRTYFKEMGEVQQLTPEQELLIWQQIDGNISAMRRHLYSFAFIYEEHIKILNDPELDDLTDIFMFVAEDGLPSSLTPELRVKWSEQIAGVYAELKKNPSPELRAKGAAVLEKYPVLLGKMLEWHDVSMRYLDNFNTGRLSRLELQSRILVPIDEFIEHVAESEKMRLELDKWKIKMLETNLRLVINIAKHFQNRGLPFGDLIQEGNLGLMKALEKFNYRLGHRFCTYASWWIRQAVSRALSAQSRVIRLPVHMLATIKKINMAEKKFIQLNGKEPEIENIAEELQMSAERIRAIKKMSVQCLSLQEPVNSDDGSDTIENFLSDKESDDPRKSYARKQMKQHLDAALNQLTERERQVIEMRYGLDGGEPKTLTDLSTAFNVTRERIRQIELKTLEKLRKLSNSGKYLDDFFLQ